MEPHQVAVALPARRGDEAPVYVQMERSTSVEGSNLMACFVVLASLAVALIAAKLAAADLEKSGERMGG